MTKYRSGNQFQTKRLNPVVEEMIAERQRKKEIDKYLNVQPKTSFSLDDTEAFPEENKDKSSFFLSFDSSQFTEADYEVNPFQTMERLKHFSRSDLVTTNEDRIKIAISEYKESVSKKISYESKWKNVGITLITSVINIASLLMIIYSSDYKETTLANNTFSPELWEAIFLLILFIYIVYSIVLLIQFFYFLRKSKKAEEMDLNQFVEVLLEKTK
jgi:hypothetical protein